MRPVRCGRPRSASSRASATARFTEKVDLPTPPLPEATATTCFTLASAPAGAPAAFCGVAGAEAGRITMERRALNTIQNALFCRGILCRHGWRRVLVVTDAFHVPRSRYIFARLGLETTVIGVRPVRPSAQWWLAHLREAAALPWTMLRGEAFRLRRR